jgi:Glyoxalase-like domain
VDQRQATIRLRSVILDCPDPSALATFYARLTGGSLDVTDPDWCEVRFEASVVKLAFQRVERYIRPEWPDGVPQQLHLDLTVNDLQSACIIARSLGAVALSGPISEPGCIYVVHADPVGHPFCLCKDD